jgi:3-methyladenine DNA glycosylase AlkC
LLKDDQELYVRRSVANHLGDIAKDHLDFALDVCTAWLDEVEASEDEARTANRRWIVRHAVRHPAKAGHRGAIALRRRAAAVKRRGAIAD